MHFTRGNCGHLKAKRDNHPSCISCTACQRLSLCFTCSIWTKKVWDLAEKRLSYSQIRDDTEKKTEEISEE